MSVATYNDYLAKIDAPLDRTLFGKQSQTVSATGRLYSTWTRPPNSGATPSTPAVPARTILGSLGQPNASTISRLARMIGGTQNDGTIWFLDRLSHQGGLSGTVTTTQTTNLPTAALTRYTDGVGVMAAVEIYTAVGTAVTALDMTYTNSSGVSGRTAQTNRIGSTDWREIGRMIIMPLQEGDRGVRSVESVTLSISTGTAGNFGVTLFYPVSPLIAVPIQIVDRLVFDSILHAGGLMPRWLDDACIWPAFIPQANSIGVASGQLHLLQE